MNLPTELEEAIEAILKGKKLSRVAEASQDLSHQYRHRESQQKTFMRTDEHRIAYTAARMPATYAAVSRVCEEIKKRMPQISPHSILDLGAGPGTAMWAMYQAFDSLETVSLIEQDQELIALGKKLTAESAASVLRTAQWQPGDLHQMATFEPHDLVVISYAIGELDKRAIPKLIEAAWAASKQLCVIVEPGSKHGFERILMARDALIGAGAHILAPCLHAKQCPLVGKDDWCHFSQRLERSFFHRQAKGATMGYEDEKFSYIVASRQPGEEFRGRILRHPEKHSGHLRLDLCTKEGIVHETLSRRHGEAYKQARHLEWGDSLSGSSEAK